MMMMNKYLNINYIYIFSKMLKGFSWFVWRVWLVH